jgi:hypothetical protein
MEQDKDIIEIFGKDENFQQIMRRLLEASIEESFNGVVIAEAGAGHPIKQRRRKHPRRTPH